MVDVPNTLRRALADRYAIERELGQGGMATVYLAEDLKHHRKVALKVLRPELAVTVGTGRFSREIDVAARLQHPNILPLLDSGEAAGFFFYVMPYVEGESLRDRLARSGELAIPEAVRILMEVADALSHAHAHGVVHRDIKPDNVLLSGRHALVADFGVAKAVTEATGRQVLTSAGVALGTPAYMAPEQATADPHQDHRVDIYALGVLGYELLAGRAPFAATTAQEMLAAHVTAVPEPLERYRPTVGPALAQVVMKCLAKRPADRWQTADDVLAHLEPLTTPDGGTTPTRTQPTPALARMPRWAKWAAGVVAVAAVALVASLVLGPRPLNIVASDFTPVTSEPGVEFQPALSADGNEVAYVAGLVGNFVGADVGLPRVFVRSTANVGGGAALLLGDTARGSRWLPAWSGDGQFVRFWDCPGMSDFSAAACAWHETGKLGGAVRPATLPPRARHRSAVAWSPDGVRVAYAVHDTLIIAAAADTSARRVAVRHPQTTVLHSLAWSPDGRRIAYVGDNPSWVISGNVWGSSIWVADASGGAPRRVTTAENLNVSPAWLDARHLLFVSNRDGPRGAYVVEVGPNGGRGAPRLVPGVADPHSISYSVGARKLAYSRFTLRQNVLAYPLGRATPIPIGDGRPVTNGSQVIEISDVSPDGRWLVFDSNRRGNMDLYKIPVGGGEAVPLASQPGDEGWPRWSPDGKEIAFHHSSSTAGSPGHIQVMVMPAEGGPPSALTTGPESNAFPAWSPSGRAIVFESSQPGSPRLWIVSRDTVGGAWHPAVPLTDFPCRYPVWAPDGSGVLCVMPRGDLGFVSPQGRLLWRRAFAGSFRSLGWNARYSRDGRTIYSLGDHQDGRRGVWAIPVAGGAPRLVVAFGDDVLAAYGALSVGPAQLFLTVSQYESDIWVANLRW